LLRLPQANKPTSRAARPNPAELAQKSLERRFRPDPGQEEKFQDQSPNQPCSRGRPHPGFSGCNGSLAVAGECCVRLPLSGKILGQQQS